MNLKKLIALLLYRIGCFIEQCGTPKKDLPTVKLRQAKDYADFKAAWQKKT